MTFAITPVVGLFFEGATLTEHDDIAPGAALVGKPSWSRAELLRNLELRLGLPSRSVSQAIRVQRFSRRMGEVLVESPGAFYERSFKLDPLGTATTMLAWRDALVVGGWNGTKIENGSDRLDTFHTIETGLSLAFGAADRLRAVEDELLATNARPLDQIILAEPVALWPGRWQRVFARLEALGTPVRVVDIAFEGARGDSDLARLQANLRGERPGSANALRGDGSIVVLRAETSWELADATAALLRANRESHTAILRGGDIHALDAALATHGLASQGLASSSAWRPALQILPLAVELAYEPRDPYRVLELLTLSTSPFEGFAGRTLAGALAKSPGIGGPTWREAKEKIAERTRTLAVDDAKERALDDVAAAKEADKKVASRLQRIHDWLEAPGCDANEKAPRAALLATAERVRAWLQGRLIYAREDAEKNDGDPSLAATVSIFGEAFAQAQAFHQAVSHESRDGLDLVEARLLVAQVASAGHRMAIAVEGEGRIDPVDAPSGMRAARDLVVWWHCVSGTEWRPPARTWRAAEVAAIQHAGIMLTDPAARLQAEAKSWHQMILSAKKRLVLAVPQWAVGEHLDPHPIFHEIAARFGADEAALARITVDARDLVSGDKAALGHARSPAVVNAGSLRLPQARVEWRLDPALLGASLRSRTAHSASSLDALLGCPLKFVFTYAAGLRARSTASISSGPKLAGTLGHRLVEELHNAGAFATPATLGASIAERFDRLIREEGAVLLRPGMTFELRQLRDQIAKAVQTLAEILAQSKLTIAGVEVVIDEPWRAGSLGGRIDLLLGDERGGEVIVDLKWGKKTYADALTSGRAMQLAVYAAARKLATKARDLPPAAYFSLSGAELLATDGRPFAGANFVAMKGPSLSETWTKMERTLEKLETTLASGRVPVTGVRQALPLVEALGVAEAERGRHLALDREGACKYCEHDALCGRRWESFS